MRPPPPRRPSENGEFLWLVSLSDLMILLFILFVVLFSFAQKRLKQSDIEQIIAALRNQKPKATPAENAAQQMQKWIDQEKLSQSVQVTLKDDAVLLDIKDKILFPSGSFDLLPEGYHIVKELTKVLEKTPTSLHLGIEGHTDDVPISTPTVRDNWELSSKRALSVFYVLSLSEPLLKRTVIQAYGDSKPRANNRAPTGEALAENQALNRRVTIRLFP